MLFRSLYLKTFIICLIIFCFNSQSNAQLSEKENVSSNANLQQFIPPALKHWQQWVLKNDQQALCPFIGQSNNEFTRIDQHVCAWSSSLDLRVTKTRAIFTQQWKVLQASTIELPGNLTNWPQSVLVNNKPSILLDKNGTPSLTLLPGEYTVTGEFRWSTMPSEISISPKTALINLVIDNQTVDFPYIENDRLLLKAQQDSKSQQNSLSVEVTRKVTDGAYISLQTNIALTVSGNNREVVIGKVLPAHFQLMAITSQLPSIIDKDGFVRVQLKPGEWDIAVNAYAPADTFVWKRPAVSHEWPDSEVWAIEQNPQYRSGRITGVPTIDAEQTNMPLNWSQSPTYLVAADSEILFDILQRGKSPNDTNSLFLDREYWLSFDHTKLTFVDNISGKIINDWRLEMMSPFTLESASDKDGPMLITEMDDNKMGVETRYALTSITARGNIPLSNLDLISGWDSTFENLSITLNLPPGTLLFGVFNVDEVSSSWLSNWSIWESFIVLFSAIIAFRLLGPLIGILTGLVLVTIYQESYAPIFFILNLLLAIAARKYVSFNKLGKLIKVYFTFSLAIAVMSILFFVAMQVRGVVYPQLESRLQFTGSSSLMTYDTVVDEALSQQPDSYERKRRSRAQVEDIVVSGKRVTRKDNILEKYQADAVVQAGSGIPSWRWKSYQLDWLGPVTQEQTFNLVVWSKNQVRIFKAFGVVLLLVWLYMLSKGPLHSLIISVKQKSQSTTVSLAWVIPWLVNVGLALSVMTFSSNPVMAQSLQANDELISESVQANIQTQFQPSEQRLRELKNWLLQAPDCVPNCVQIQRVTVSTTANNELQLTLDVHANIDGAIALPKSAMWSPNKVLIKRNSASSSNSASLMSFNGWTFIHVNKGIHSIVMTGRVAPISQWQLSFKDKPKSVLLNKNSQWEISGLSNNNQMIGNDIEFSTPASKPGVIDALATSSHSSNKGLATNDNGVEQYTPKALIKVTRQLTFDQNWRMNTIVTRISPSQGSIITTIPLLETESVTSSDMLIRNNRINVTLPANSLSFEWTSRLQQQASLTLRAPVEMDYIEHWQFVANPSWHLAFTNIPEFINIIDNDDYSMHEFYPYPGETLDIEITRPSATKGSPLAIDNVELSMQQGNRSTDISLNFDYRSTQGTEHTITLPDEYTLSNVFQNQQRLNVSASKNRLTLSLLPGKNNITIEMISEQQPRFITQQPRFNLHAPTSNLKININLNEQRWVLATQGPVIGPAVLYWGELLVFILIALLLSRVAFSPLSTVAWILLGVGLSVNNWSVLVMVALWFAAIWASTFRDVDMPSNRYNFTQLCLFIFSMITLLALISVIPISLLSSPDMGIAGNATYQVGLSWFDDQSMGEMPEITIFSLPIYAYKGLMLAWVIWLCFSLVNWVKWAWIKLGEQGYWRDSEKNTSTTTSAKE